MGDLVVEVMAIYMALSWADGMETLRLRGAHYTARFKLLTEWRSAAAI
jgi:hypothetical protein